MEHLADLVPSTGSGPSRRERVLRSMAAAQAYEMTLFSTLVDGLGDIPGVSMCPAPAGRCPTVAFRVGDQLPGTTAELLGNEGICVFAGDYYASEYFDEMGLRSTGGAVRASIYHYSTAEEVTRLLDAVKRCR